jgi:hypothetical protein
VYSKLNGQANFCQVKFWRFVLPDLAWPQKTRRAILSILKYEHFPLYTDIKTSF